MPELLTRPLLRREDPTWGSQVPWLAGVLAAAWALAAGLALAAVPVLVVWIAGGAASPLPGALRLGADVWLAAHRVGVPVDGTVLRLAPLGLTLLIVLLLHHGARWAAHAAAASGGRLSLWVGAPAVLTYAVGAAAVTLLAGGSGSEASALEAVVLAAVVAAVGVGSGIAREAGIPARLRDPLPVTVRAALLGGLAGAAAMVLVASVLAATSVITHRSRVAELTAALDAGVVGTGVLLVLSAAVLVNGIGWAWAFSVGEGFAVGTGTTVSPAGVELGPLPALPVLGAVPDAVPEPFAWFVLAGPLLAGVAAGWIASDRLARLARAGGSAGSQDSGPGMVDGALAGVGAALATSVVAVVATVLAGGSLGAERLAEIGADPWAVGAGTLLWVGLPALVTGVLRTRR